VNISVKRRECSIKRRKLGENKKCNICTILGRCFCEFAPQANILILYTIQFKANVDDLLTGPIAN